MDALMAPWMRYLIAFLVFSHGFIYVCIGSVLPAPVAGWRGSSWFLGSSVTSDQLKVMVVALHVIAGILIAACAVAIGLAPSLPGWWRPLALGGAVFGVAAFATFWDGQTRLLLEEGAIGAAISLFLFLTALAWPRAFA